MLTNDEIRERCRLIAGVMREAAEAGDRDEAVHIWNLTSRESVEWAVALHPLVLNITAAAIRDQVDNHIVVPPTPEVDTHRMALARAIMRHGRLALFFLLCEQHPENLEVDHGAP